MTNENRGRRSLLAGLGAVASAFALGTRRAQAQTTTAPTGGVAFQPARHPQDDWMNALPGKHRTVIDCAAAPAAGTGVFYANNIFTANRNGYQLNDSDVAVIVVLRHEATPYAYNDAIWARYGTVLGPMVRINHPKTNQPPTVNPLNSAEFGPVMTSLGLPASAIIKRGAHFAICDMATNRIAGVIARAVNSTAPEIYKELVANILPNGHMAAAGVVAINRAQEYGYSMLTAG
jgi:hypothetical protein